MHPVTAYCVLKCHITSQTPSILALVLRVFKKMILERGGHDDIGSVVFPEVGFNAGVAHGCVVIFHYVRYMYTSLQLLLRCALPITLVIS